jgi:hypothetical protein
LEVYPAPAALGSFRVSLLAIPFPKGGSRGGTLWSAWGEEEGAAAHPASAEASAAAMTSFFTISSGSPLPRNWAVFRNIKGTNQKSKSD